MIQNPVVGQRAFLLEIGPGNTKGPATETYITEVISDAGGITVKLSNGTVLRRDGEKHNWHTEDPAYAFTLLKDKPDLRHLLATRVFDDAFEAAVFFAQAAAVGGGHAPEALCQLLGGHGKQVRSFGEVFQLTRRANEKSQREPSMGMDRAWIHGKNQFVFLDNGNDITAIVWQCLRPQCGYVAPQTQVVAEYAAGGKVVVKISGRPEGVWKRLKDRRHEFVIKELAL